MKHRHRWGPFDRCACGARRVTVIAQKKVRKIIVDGDPQCAACFCKGRDPERAAMIFIRWLQMGIGLAELEPWLCSAHRARLTAMAAIR